MENRREKWEYCRLQDVQSTDYFNARLVFYTSDGERIEQITGKQGHEQNHKVALRIAALGNDGWEMIGTGSLGGGVHTIYFKRRII